MIDGSGSTYVATLRRVLGVVALLGVLAMHGLGLHGTSHDESMAMDRMPMVAAHAIGETLASVHPPLTPGHALGMAGGMCVAVLLLAGLLASRRGPGVAQPTRNAAPSVVRPERSRRGRAPPDLFALSIQRT